MRTNEGDLYLAKMLPIIREQFPNAKWSKNLLNQPQIVVPQKDYKFKIRGHKWSIKISFSIPVLWTVITVIGVIGLVIYSRITSNNGSFYFPGGSGLIIISLIVSRIFQRSKKEEIEKFREYVTATENYLNATARLEEQGVN